MLKVIDNFLPESFQEELFNVFMSRTIYWYWHNTNVTFEGSDKSFPQLVHAIYSDNEIKSDFFNLVRPIVYFIEKELQVSIKEICRIKANLIPKIIYTNEELEASFHTDINEPNYISVLYYVNNSDGDTVINTLDKAELISPIKGRCVIFNSATKHRPTPPQNNRRRVVLNFVLKI